MPITRTPIVDDDGSGTTGTVLDNAWKQELYNQIDGIAGPAATTNWTPIDVSGAGLVLAVYGARFYRSGPLVILNALIGYPATVDAAVAKIGGLPASPGIVSGGLYSTYGIGQVFHIPQAVNQIYPFNPTTGAQRTNAEMSGLVIGFAGVYFES